MSKVVLLNVDLVNADVVVCYGMKKYKKILKKQLNTKEYDYTADEVDIKKADNAAGLCITLEPKSGGSVSIIGIGKGMSVERTERTIVHELSHCVSDIMEVYGLDCDETRSYILDRLYGDVMNWYRSEVL